MLLLLMRPSASAPSSLETEQVQDNVEELKQAVQHKTAEVGAVLHLKDEEESAPKGQDDSRSSSKTAVPRATLSKDGLSLTDYLEHHFPIPTSSSATPATHVWLTLASASFLRSGAFALHTFAEQLSKERIASGREKHGRQTAVVTLCLDEGCVKEASERGMYAYGGFMWNRPEKVYLMLISPC